MDVTQVFQFEIVGAVVIIGGILIWAIRQEGRINALEREFERELAQLKAKHEKDLATIIDNNRANNTVIWDKLDSTQKMVMDVIKSLGRLEGKMESKG